MWVHFPLVTDAMIVLTGLGKHIAHQPGAKAHWFVEKTCAGCHLLAYCSRECQREDWEARHRDECSDMHENYLCMAFSLSLATVSALTIDLLQGKSTPSALGTLITPEHFTRRSSGMFLRRGWTCSTGSRLGYPTRRVAALNATQDGRWYIQLTLETPSGL